MRQPTFPRVKSAGAPQARDARIAAFAARQHAAVTIDQLRTAGLTDAGVVKRVGRGVLYRRYRGVYVVGQPTLSADGERMAAVLAAGPGAALSHIALAQLRGISRFQDHTLHVSAPRLRQLKGVVVHKVRRLDPRDVTTYRGIPSTTVHRLFVDLAETMTPHQLANVMHEAAFHGWFVEAAIRDAVTRANGRHKLAVVERAIALHNVGCPGTKSAGEDAFLALVEDDEPLVNLHVEGRQVDFHWPGHRLVVEIDGAGHGRDPTHLDDTHRDGLLRAAGWTVLRFSRAAVLERPDDVKDSTLRAIRSSSDAPPTARDRRAAGRDGRPRDDRAA